MTFPGGSDHLDSGTVRQDSAPPATARHYSDLEPGQRIDDFDLLAIVGQGGFARVFLARQRSMQRLVALKVSADSGAEPQTLAQLDHPHIVRVYDQRILPGQGLRLLYMPYLAGGTLKEVIARVKAAPRRERNGKLLLETVDAALAARGESPPVDSSTRERLAGMSWPEAVCWLGARLAEALAYAQRRGVLHRDIKPANVLLGADCAPRLADFNVSESSAVNEAGEASKFGGSLAYASPEQLDAFNPEHPRTPDSLDARSDIYSLGLTLWEVFSGERPFTGDDEGGVQTLTSLSVTRRTGLSTVLALKPDVAASGLHEVLARCLQPEPEDRFPNADALALQLELCRKPATRRLLNPEPGWRTWAARHPALTLYAIGLSFNMLASWFSIEYNKAAIVDTAPATRDMFKLLQFIINGTFFPLCMALFWVVIRPVVQGLARQRAGPLAPEDAAAIRHRSLRLGPLSVQVCLWAWVAAGAIFPAAMHFAVHELPLSFHAHFLASQTLCGMVAVSYPQFLITFLALRVYYPRFVENASLSADDLDQLRRLDRNQNFFLLLAALIPMLAVGLLAGIGAERIVVLGVLFVAGGLGFGLAYVLTNAIREDRAALEALAAR